MLRQSRAELDYFELVKRSRRLAAAPSAGAARKKLRLALLGDASTQHLVPLLRVLFSDAGIDAEIHDADYDTISVEAFDEGSALYAFRPDVVALLHATGKLRNRFYERADRSELCADETAAIVRVWDAIRARSQATIIQSTFVTPYERPYGNYGQKLPLTLESVTHEVNRAITAAATARAGVFLADLDDLAGWVGRRSWFDEKLWQLSKSPCALEHLPLLARCYVDIAAATVGVGVKCVVLDLDNTLWGGIIGDDGLDGIRLGELDDGPSFRAFQQYLLELSRRGIILAVCSKNDHENAVRPFREHPDMVLREKDISVFVANWEHKAKNIKLIQETLNIGLDSMVFLDDSPFERNLVREMLPEVTVPELPEDAADYVKAISEHNLFETASHSAFDEDRAKSYREQVLRQREQASYGNLDEYLGSLGTRATVRPFDPFNLPRIAQLMQRSNQFNLTTRRYGQVECEAFMKDPGRHTLSVSIRDRVGDFGLILVAILRFEGTDAVVDQLLMSCRVLQRGVEQLAMNQLVAAAQGRGMKRVVGHFLPTAKNGMVKDFFARFGFAKTEEDAEGNATWVIETSAYVPIAVRIEVDAEPASQRAEAAHG